MKAYYINLESAMDRRLSIEKSFNESNSDSTHSLTRFNAVTADQIQSHNIGGTLTAAEKACFLSHRSIIELNKDATDFIWILEDDSRFSPQTISFLIESIRNLSNTNWDILMTDILVTNPADMLELALLKHQLNPSDIEVLSLNKLVWAGSMSYVINPKSINKFLNSFNDLAILNVPYDLYLRDLVYSHKLSAFVTFPFITTQSTSSFESQIQNHNTELNQRIHSTFRKMMFISSEPLDYLKDLIFLEKFTDDRSKSMAQLISLFFSKSYKAK
jgi:GR25 family glycosyltransferase involved in LPS biosynthesis